MDIHLIGVLIGVAVAVVLITLKLSPVIALFTGAAAGALVGGLSLANTLEYVIIGGSASMALVFVRILAAGVLVGVLVESGAAEVIARTIVDKLGAKRAVLAITLSCMLLTAVGVFNTVSIVMLSPLALAVGQKANVSKLALLLALSGGSKAGNVISPNPNTAAVAEYFGLPISDLMVAGFIPALFALVATVLLAGRLVKKGSQVAAGDTDAIEQSAGLPSFLRAISGPAIAVAVLVLSPVLRVFGVEFQIDAFFVLPLSGVLGLLIMGRGKQIISFATKGVQRVMPVSLMLIGAGAVGALIRHSAVPGMLADGIVALGLPGMLLAPSSSAMLAAATGSAVTGAALAAGIFAETLVAVIGVSALSAAAMLHAGCVFIDVMPHGNIFLASKESMGMSMKERLKLVPLEAAIGGILVVVSTILFGFIWT